MSIDLAQHLMGEYAERTGLTGDAPPRRYLWTDAYAVCNFFALHHRTEDALYLQLAEKLIDQVHHVLGRHRPDDDRGGWISGLSEQEGERHPTCGGLRIGKSLNERKADERYDADQEWVRDGQYFHYLTKWTHALSRAAQETQQEFYAFWAVELAIAAYEAFTVSQRSGGSNRMYWKMSIDLSRPLVDSMGHHDPLEGLVTCLELGEHPVLDEQQQTALNNAMSDYRIMCARNDGATSDALGIGGLLDCIVRVILSQPMQEPAAMALLDKLFRESAISLREFAGSSRLSMPADRRLAFRELGLSIGLRGLEMLDSFSHQIEILASPQRDVMLQYELAEQIESCWLKAQNREKRVWKAHEDINSVMLATSLDVDGYYGFQQ